MTITIESAATAATVGIVAGATFAIGKSLGEFASECAGRALAAPASAVLRGCDKVNLSYADQVDGFWKLSQEEQARALAYLMNTRSALNIPVGAFPGVKEGFNAFNALSAFQDLQEAAEADEADEEVAQAPAKRKASSFPRKVTKKPVISRQEAAA